MIYDWIVIGGGASGLMFAAMKKVNKGIILEATNKLGNKLLLTGGGHCNLTHVGSIKNFIQCYGDAGRALRKILYKYNNFEMINFFESNGFELMCEDDKYYPASMKAADVHSFLFEKALSNGWEIKCNSKVLDADFQSHRIICGDTEYCGRNVLIATGGITYPETGSDGSMFEILRNHGINIIQPRSALAAVHVVDYPYGELAGVSVKDVCVSVINNRDSKSTGKRNKISKTGDLLFTHTGFSGPVILNLSRYLSDGNQIYISYNNALDELPKRFCKVLEDRARNDKGDIKTKFLEKLLENDTFTVEKVDSNGIITCGGIALEEINIKDMSLKKFSNVYVAGEAIDADGETGGYNLQLCYTTAAGVAEGQE